MKSLVNKHSKLVYQYILFRVFLAMCVVCFCDIMVCAGIASGQEKEVFLPSPAGRIILPVPESLTGNRIDISGYTENLTAENRFVWLAVDREEEGLSWPLYKPIPENGSFTVRINAAGHLNAVHISLYAVDQTTHDRITDWMNSDKSGGMTHLPNHSRLHRVRLWNQKPME